MTVKYTVKEAHDIAMKIAKRQSDLLFNLKSKKITFSEYWIKNELAGIIQRELLHVNSKSNGEEIVEKFKEYGQKYFP